MLNYYSGGPYVLKRLHVVANGECFDEEKLFEKLSEYNVKQIIINEGLVIHFISNCQEISYTVLKCEPNYGVLDNETLVFVEKCAEELNRIQLLWVIQQDGFEKLLKTLYKSNDTSFISYKREDYVTKLKNQHTVTGEGPYYATKLNSNAKYEFKRTVSLNSNFDKPIDTIDQVNTPNSLIKSIFDSKLEPFLTRNANKIYFAGQIFYACDLQLLVYAIYPPDKPGIVTNNTEIYLSLDPWGEYEQVSIAPIKDTLPKIYDCDLYEDYLYPALKNRFKETFRIGDSFNHLGVDFKITCAIPSITQFGCMRIGLNTQVHLEEPLEPSLVDVIPSEDWNRIRMLTPRQQHIALHIAASQLDESAMHRIFSVDTEESKISEDIVKRLSSKVKSYELNNQRGEAFSDCTRTVSMDSFVDIDPIGFEYKDVCTVCCQKFKDFDKYITLQCGHLFHWYCVRHWIRENLTCPNCRSLCN